MILLDSKLFTSLIRSGEEAIANHLNNERFDTYNTITVEILGFSGLEAIEAPDFRQLFFKAIC